MKTTIEDVEKAFTITLNAWDQARSLRISPEQEDQKGMNSRLTELMNELRNKLEILHTIDAARKSAAELNTIISALPTTKFGVSINQNDLRRSERIGTSLSLVQPTILYEAETLAMKATLLASEYLESVINHLKSDFDV